MKKYTFSSTVALVFMLLYCSISFASTVPKDIVLMIDNSGSMKKGDPFFMTKDALTEFVEKLPDDTQVAVLIFDHRINLAVPLTTISEATKEDILASFDNIDYRGMLTNIPAAMERAIYELKTQGQEESQKSIIFITDGIVDTGDKLRDIDKTRWLRENLSEDAANHGIKIFGIAFTDLADFELIQSLAQKTKGQYFRAVIPEEIPDVFSQIHQLIMSMKPESIEPASPPLTVPPLLSEEPPKPEIEKSPIYVTEAPEPTPTPVKSKKLNLPIIILIVLAVFAVIAVFFLFWFRRKPSIIPPLPEGRVDVTDELLPEASLRDVSGVTEQGIFKISKKVTKIGRKDRINHIAIDQETISRQHAIIEYKNYSFWIIDQGSSNGTFLNGKQIVDEVQLNHGDTISFDVYEFEFVMPGMEFDETVVDKTVFRRAHDPK
ncbi:VWA domain-containing protein, partial [bacterium]|nr:VWA domain-containing protein [bacterium]